MTPQKIICTVSNDLSYDQRMQRICTSLSEAGHTVTLVGRKRTNSKILNQQVYQQVRINCVFESGPLFYFMLNVRLFFYLLFQDFDIINSIDLDSLPAGRLIKLFRRKKLVFDAHEYYEETPELHGRNFTKRIWETIARLCIPGTDERYTVNESLALILSEKYKCPFGIVENVPWLREHQTKEPQQRKVILYQGVLNKGRGLEQMIEAMREFPNIECWMAGDGDVSDQLKRQVKEAGLSNVKFLGFQDPEKLKSLTHKAWLGINVLDGESLNYKYSLANKFFDYMHAHVPSLNMDFPEYRRIISEYPVGLLLEQLEVSQIVSAINSLLNNPERYRRMVAACESAKCVYNWQQTRERLLQFYEFD